MPPEGYSTITVPDEVFERVTEVMIEYDYDGIADAVDTASAVALKLTKQLWLSSSLNDSRNEPQNRKTALLREKRLNYGNVRWGTL